MNIYVTTDTHFNHMKLAEVFKDRPLDFQERILDSHSKLDADTYLIHLGDFCIGKDQESMDKWNKATAHIKHRVLVRGNHDKKSNAWYMERGFNAVVDQLVLNLYGNTVVFSHIPVDHTYWLATDFNIHGHTHGNRHRDFEIKDYYDINYHIEIALEHSNYSPVLINDKLFKFKER